MIRNVDKTCVIVDFDAAILMKRTTPSDPNVAYQSVRAVTEGFASQLVQDSHHSYQVSDNDLKESDIYATKMTIKHMLDSQNHTKDPNMKKIKAIENLVMTQFKEFKDILATFEADLKKKIERLK